MAELDDMLSASLKRVAEPEVTSAGVADAIRSRVAAGDTGTPAASSGFAGGGGPLSWLPWIGLVVVAAVVGGSLGPLGVLGRITDEIGPPVPVFAIVGDSDAAALECVGGDLATRIPAGTRVLAVARTEDLAYLGVRNPLATAATVWVANAAVVQDEGQDAASLPVGGACPDVQTLVVAPTDAPVPPAPTPTPGPTQPPNPPPTPGDSTAPSVLQVGAGPSPTFNSDPITVSVVASDNVGVASVAISWTGPTSGSGSMQQSGGQWIFVYSVPNPNTTNNGNFVFTVQAFDAAGNASAPAQSNAVNWQYFG